jgi:hypothetical protein
MLNCCAEIHLNTRGQKKYVKKIDHLKSIGLHADRLPSQGVIGQQVIFGILLHDVQA